MSSFLVKGLLVSVLLLMAGASFAQELTLDDCIELALRNRSAIITARGSEELAQASHRAALGAFLPRLDASASYRHSKQNDQRNQETFVTGSDTVYALLSADNSSLTPASLLAIEVPTEYGVREFELPDFESDGKSVSLSASMSLIDLGDWFRVSEAAADKSRAHLDVIASEQDMILSVKMAYFAYLAAHENVAVQQDALERSTEQLKLIESKFELGSAALSDVLKQKVQFGNDRVTLISAENSAVTTMADLAYTVGLDPAGEIDFSTQYTPREFVGALDEAIGFGHLHQPALLASEKSSDAAGYALKGARTRYLPTLGGYADYSWSASTNNYGDDDDSWNSSSGYGLSLSWNLFDGFAREQSVAMAKINRNNSLARLSEQRNFVTLAIKRAYLAIGKTRIQQQVAQENVEAASEDLKITQEKYDLGAATILEVLDAQVSLKSAQVLFIQAGFNLNLAVASLENAMGKM